MEPGDDQDLNALLREWQVSDAPPSLDGRVPGLRDRWWRTLLTGSIRIPVPVALALAAILLVMTVMLLRPRPAEPSRSINLEGFRPVNDLNVRVIRGHDSK
jgi:hypothetical protein